MSDTVRLYTGKDIDVTYDTERCIHAAECTRSLPAVFNTSRRPWILPDGASADAIAALVAKCPSGALHFTRHDGGDAEAPPEHNSITETPGGPLYVRGLVQLQSADGTVILNDTRLALCRCGQSRNKPFCDSSHLAVSFDDAVAVPAGEATSATKSANGAGLRATQSSPPPASHSTTPSFGRIATIESLKEHLQWAIELEHFTLPPYLCALYSLEPGLNPEAAEVVSSVLVEEMLHMTLAANLLNAVGGQPRLDTPRMLVPYPRCMPHGDRSFEVSLLRFSPEALEQFLRIEQPTATGDLPESDNYETIGQFYDAIRQGLRDLCGHLGEANLFCGALTRQVTDAFRYDGSGRIIAVRDLPTALAALDEIVEQGEGTAHVQVWDGDRDMFHPEREEVAHYYRFQELKLGRRYRRGDTPHSGPTGDLIAIDWDSVRPMQSNPRTANHAPGSPIRTTQEKFNRSYCDLLRLLEQAFNGNPEILGAAIGAMYGLKAQAIALMQMPTEDGLAMAGPTFEYVAPYRRATSA